MKKVAFAIFALTLSLGASSQNSFLNNGNQGNTTNVQSNLHVGAHMKVDSGLVVTDSALFQSSLMTEGSLRVDEEAYFMNKVFMNFLTESLGIEEPDLKVMLRAEDGEVKTYGIHDLINAIAAEMEPAELATCFPDYAANPYWVSAVNRLYTVCEEVRVGIGTIDPLFKLHVVGTAYAQRIMVGNPDAPVNALINGVTGSQGQDLLFLGKKIGSTEESRFKVTNDGTVYVYNNAGPALVIYNSSYDPQSPNENKILQLEDNGLLRAREIRIDVVNWADFVFDDDYTLMSLPQVAEYIMKHRHLPGLPSEKEVKEEGIDVADMQAIQLQKIEELTLYMIEMDQKMNQLNEKVNALEQENRHLKERLK